MIKVSDDKLTQTTERYILPEWVAAMYQESQQNPDGLSRELAYRMITKWLPYIRYNQSKGYPY